MDPKPFPYSRHNNVIGAYCRETGRDVTPLPRTSILAKRLLKLCGKKKPPIAAVVEGDDDATAKIVKAVYKPINENLQDMMRLIDAPRRE